jgi:hypothetical protein
MPELMLKKINVHLVDEKNSRPRGLGVAKSDVARQL